MEQRTVMKSMESVRGHLHGSFQISVWEQHGGQKGEFKNINASCMRFENE